MVESVWADSYELARPSQVRQVLEDAPIAFLPVGCVEYHGPHLPLGVDMLTAKAFCHRTAVKTGGLVLPPLWLAAGVLPLPHGVVLELEPLRQVVRAILHQLAEGGFEVLVVFSGHGALDHLHVLREESDQVMKAFPTVKAFTTVWNELNAGLQGDIHDHGAKVETSYMMEFFPESVDLTALDSDPSSEHLGVYGLNPRFTASRDWGVHMAENAIDRLAGLVHSFRSGERPDNWALLRELVERLQTGDLQVVAESGTNAKEGEGGIRLDLHNPHSQSKYITELASFRINGVEANLEDGTLSNPSLGEGHTDSRIDGLGPLSGFYVRRNQMISVSLPRVELPNGWHLLEGSFVLADVFQIEVSGEFEVR